MCLVTHVASFQYTLKSVIEEYTIQCSIFALFEIHSQLCLVIDRHRWEEVQRKGGICRVGRRVFTFDAAPLVCHTGGKNCPLCDQMRIHMYMRRAVMAAGQPDL